MLTFFFGDVHKSIFCLGSLHKLCVKRLKKKEKATKTDARQFIKSPEIFEISFKIYRSRILDCP